MRSAVALRRPTHSDTDQTQNAPVRRSGRLNTHRHTGHDKTVASVSCLAWRCELTSGVASLEQSVERLPPPRHIQFGTVSLPASSRCVRICQAGSADKYQIYVVGWLGIRVISVLDSGAEGRGFKSQPRRCRITVLGKLFTPIVPLFTKPRNW